MIVGGKKLWNFLKSRLDNADKYSIMKASQVKSFLKGKQMKVSQHIAAGQLTGCWLSSWNNEITLNFGEDKVEFKANETELRELGKRVADRLAEIEKERAEELAKAVEESVDE